MPLPRKWLAARSAHTLDGVAAIVNDVVIFRSDVGARVRRLEGDLPKEPHERQAKRREQEKQILVSIVDEVLIAQAAAKEEIVVADAAVADAITTTANSMNMNREQLAAAVTKRGYTMPEYEDEIRNLLLEATFLFRKARPVAKAGPDRDAEIAKYRERLLIELRGRAYVEVR